MLKKKKKKDIIHYLSQPQRFAEPTFSLWASACATLKCGGQPFYLQPKLLMLLAK